MFGRVHKPYAGGTGNSQDGPSQERQEREDEEGISKARQTLVLGFVEREGPLGITYRELCKYTGWVGGQATGALSVLDTAGEIIRLVEKRSGQSVYVMEKFRGGREIAKRRRSAADKARKELSGVELKLSIQEKQNAILAEHVAKSDATVGEVTQRLAAVEDARRLAVEEATRLREERDIYQQRAMHLEERLQHSEDNAENMARAHLYEVEQARLAREQAEQVQVRLDAMTRENSVHRIATSLRMTLEPEETEIVLRTARTLGDPRVQKLGNDFPVKVTLEVVRALMRVIGRSTRFGSEDANQPPIAPSGLPALPRRPSTVDNS